MSCRVVSADTNSSRRREFVYPIQHGRLFVMHGRLFVMDDTTWTFIRYANDFQPHVFLPQATVYMLLKIYDQRHKKKLKVGEGGKSMSVEGYRMVQGHPPLPNFQN